MTSEVIFFKELILFSANGQLCNNPVGKIAKKKQTEGVRFC